ncbi:uncharacterized protein LOC130848450 [Hippopotamus amphibius kiboko]|uniref:uncharacterized protein LOC130848450 n=1 Tax=Hippopotamus amphibius kiboko TaxID=575201 RepID=UPI0025972413|nr:uncharacterized protein LOC130848450 [Hippopotamus amphibius kiboko]
MRRGEVPGRTGFGSTLPPRSVPWWLDDFTRLPHSLAQGGIRGTCVTFTALLNDSPSEKPKRERQLDKSKSHSRVGLKSSTKQKTTIFSTLASEKSLSDCKKVLIPLMSPFVGPEGSPLDKPSGVNGKNSVQEHIRKLRTIQATCHSINRSSKIYQLNQTCCTPKFIYTSSHIPDGGRRAVVWQDEPARKRAPGQLSLRLRGPRCHCAGSCSASPVRRVCGVSPRLVLFAVGEAALERWPLPQTP